MNSKGIDLKIFLRSRVLDWSSCDLMNTDLLIWNMPTGLSNIIYIKSLLQSYLKNRHNFSIIITPGLSSENSEFENQDAVGLALDELLSDLNICITLMSKYFQGFLYWSNLTLDPDFEETKAKFKNIKVSKKIDLITSLTIYRDEIELKKNLHLFRYAYDEALHFLTILSKRPGFRRIRHVFQNITNMKTLGAILIIVGIFKFSSPDDRCCSDSCCKWSLVGATCPMSICLIFKKLGAGIGKLCGTFSKCTQCCWQP